MASRMCKILSMTWRYNGIRGNNILCKQKMINSRCSAFYADFLFWETRRIRTGMDCLRKLQQNTQSVTASGNIPYWTFSSIYSVDREFGRNRSILMNCYFPSTKSIIYAQRVPEKWRLSANISLLIKLKSKYCRYYY